MLVEDNVRHYCSWKWPRFKKVHVSGFLIAKLIGYLAKCFPLATLTPGLCFVFLLKHMIQLILQPFFGLS